MKLHFLFLSLLFICEIFGQENPGWQSSEQATPARSAAWLAASGHTGPGGTNPAPAPDEPAQIAAASIGAAIAAAPPTPTSGGNEADEITPAIGALACGLHFDPVKIYEYVHNYIEFEPYYGSKKGAHLTLLEGSGNDFDQCSLMMALLRASGKTATYKFGACYFSYTILAKWVGLSATPYSHLSDTQFSAYYGGIEATLTNRKRLAVFEFFDKQGYFYQSPTTVNGDEWFELPHVWIEYTDGGTLRQLSPSFKQHQDATGIDLGTASGYSRSQMLTDAGGIVGTSPDSVTSVNYAAISSRLGILTQSLLSHLKNNEHGRAAAKVTGTRTILRKTYASLADADPILPWAVPWLTAQTWSAIPDVQMSKLQIVCGTGAFNSGTGLFATNLLNQTVKMPALKGRKLSLAFVGNTASVRLDEILLGSFTLTASSVEIRLNATHNHYELDASTYAVITSSLGKSNQAEIKTYLKADANAYALIYSFGNPDKLSRERQEVLDGYRRSGLTETDWKVKTELLNVMGLQWLYQTWQQEKVLAPLFNVLSVQHHRFGRVAQETSFYIDVGLQFSATNQRNQDSGKESFFKTFGSFVASAMEHGVIEQLQGEDKAATSTVKMVYLANQQAIPLYVAALPNWSAVSTQLGSTYPAATKTSIQTEVTTNGAVALLPKNGLIAPNPTQTTPAQWKGFGYALEKPGSIAMLISGGYSGGYNAAPGTVNLGFMLALMTGDPAYLSSPGTNLSVPYAAYTTPPAISTDPVDMASGAFLLDKTELTVGGGTAPRGLSFSRHYNSNRRFDKSSGLGYGWTHNYDMSATKRTSVKAGLAETISYHSAPFLAAMKAASDIYSQRIYGFIKADSVADTISMPNHGLLAGDRVRIYTKTGATLPAPLSKSTFYYVILVDTDTIKLSATSGGTAINLTNNGTDTTGAAGGYHYLNRDLSPKNWATAALIIQWAVDQLKYNAVAITMGNKTIEFVKMPDGSYEAPAGMNLSLSRFGNPAGPNNVPPSTEYFTVTERHGPTYTFNTSGKIASITDLWAKSQIFTYAGTKLSSVSDGYGRTLTFTCPADKITSVTDSTGRGVSFTYTGDDLTGVTDVEAKTWTYVYDADRRMTHTKDPSVRLIVQNYYDSENRVCEQRTFGDAARTWKLCYTGYCNMEERPLLPGATTPPERTCFLFDGRGRSIGTVNPLGNRMDCYYDGHDRLIKTDNPKGEVTDYYFDKNNNLYRINDPIGIDGLTSYDTQNRVATITDKRGKITTVNLYNAQHQPRIVTAPLGRVTTTSYTTDGEVDTVTDAENNVTDYDYDTKGRVLTIKVNNQTTQTFTYTDDRGDPATSKNALNQVTAYTYNKRRQIRTTTLPVVAGQAQAVIELTYDNEGNLASTIDPRLNTSAQTYTPTGKPSTITAPAIAVLGGGSFNNVVTTNYDVRDWHSGVVNSANHATSITYDAAQRVSESYDPLNHKTTTAYDANSRPTQITDPLSRITKAAYTARGERRTNTDGLNKNTLHFFDNNGNRTKLTNRRGKDYLFGYDDASRLTSTATPTGKTTSQTYWNNDLLKTVTEPSNQETGFVYDARLRLQAKTEKASPGGTTTAITNYAYDGASTNILTVTEGTAVISRTYDERNRLKTFTNADNDLLKYEYDAADNLTRITYPPDAANPTGKQVNYTYNARNLLETVTDWAGRGTTYRYDRLGRLLRTDRPNGTSCVRDLDAAGQLLSQREIITATSRVFHYQKFNYDAAGQIQSKFSAPAGHPWTDPPFTGTYDDDNRLSTANGQTVTHDADGNMTNGPIRATSGTLAITYNSRNQLTSVGGITYTYDAEGRRRTMVQGVNTTRYTIDPNGKLSRLLVKHNADGTKTYYVYGYGLLYETNKPGAAAESTITHHYDQVGSTILRTDDTGNDVGRAEYSPYGQLTWQTGSMATPFLYNGKYGVMTDANGLLHMRARFYSPYLMRFLNPDPIGFSGGQNWFAYADGNPIAANDPMGMTTAAADWKDDTKEWLSTNAQVIRDAAIRNGVSPRDLANALAEENQARGVSDTIQDSLTEYSVMLGNGVTSAAHWWKDGHHRNADIGPANINFDAAEGMLRDGESPDIQNLADRLLTPEGTAEFGARLMSRDNAVIAPYLEYVWDPNELTAMRTNAWREGAERLGQRIDAAAGGDIWMYTPNSGNNASDLKTRLDYIDGLFPNWKPQVNGMWK